MTAVPLNISFHSGRRGPDRVSVSSSRPVLAARLLEKRSPAEALSMLPRLYSVCAMAQLDAGRRALNAAAGISGDSRQNSSDRQSVLLETAREHLWRVLIDWPALLDSPPDPGQVAALGQLNQSLRSPALDGPSADDPSPVDRLSRLLAASVFRLEPGEWSALDCEELRSWSFAADTSAAKLVSFLFAQGWEDAGATEPAFLPNIDAAELNGRLSQADSDEFVARPEWEGRTCETTPLLRQRGSALVSQATRRWGAGAMARVLALLTELAGIPDQLKAVSITPGTAAQNKLPQHTGLSQVDAARGTLVHRAVITGQRIERYQVLAPTEWNCHPRGVLARSLSALNSSCRATLRRQAELLITAIDPCVGYSLEVH